MPKGRVRLGSEHPLWDKREKRADTKIVLIGSLSLVMLFDNVSVLFFGYTSILERVSAYPIILPAVVLIAFGVYLVKGQVLGV